MKWASHRTLYTLLKIIKIGSCIGASLGVFFAMMADVPSFRMSPYFFLFCVLCLLVGFTLIGIACTMFIIVIALWRREVRQLED